LKEYKDELQAFIDNDELDKAKNLFLESLTAFVEGFEQATKKTVAVGVFFDPAEWGEDGTIGDTNRAIGHA
jgi:hypothetical protein